LLDTNILTEAIRPRPDPSVALWLQNYPPEALFIASVVLGEVWQGLAALPEGRRKLQLLSWFAGSSGPRSLFAGRILPLDEMAAMQWAEFIAAGRMAGRPRSPLDMQIAAIAKVNGCAVVTLNQADFAPLKGEVELIDPRRI
jgi:predicted nucleic acid-binding protein